MAVDAETVDALSKAAVEYERVYRDLHGSEGRYPHKGYVCPRDRGVLCEVAHVLSAQVKIERYSGLVVTSCVDEANDVMYSVVDTVKRTAEAEVA